jgi:hypothetical protein
MRYLTKLGHVGKESRLNRDQELAAVVLAIEQIIKVRPYLEGQLTP